MSNLWVHDQLSAKKWTGQHFTHVQHKLDGWRCTFFKQPNGQVMGFGKDREKAGEDRRMDLEFITRFPRIADDLKIQFARMKPYTSVDVEITTDQSSRSDVITALKQSHSARARLNYVAFAVPFYAGGDCRNHEMMFARGLANGLGFAFAPYLAYADFMRDLELVSMIECDVRSEAGELSKKLGIEGFMLKDGGQYGKWYKLKREPTVDCVIVDVIDGNGKYENQVGALVVAVYDRATKKLVEIASCSGMTDEVRKSMTKNHASKKLVGRVVELKYQLVGAGGRLVHPRFVRFREDKLARSCTYDQLESGE